MKERSTIFLTAVWLIAGAVFCPAALSGAENDAGIVAESADPGEVVLPDTDKDGIPDEIEVLCGLDAKNPADALLDSDGDGFSNLFEFESKTNPADPFNHLPFRFRWRVQKVVRVDYPVQLVALKADSADKKEWLLSVEITGKAGVEKRDLQINDQLTIRRKRFRVTDVEKGENSAKMVLSAIIAPKQDPVVVELKLGEKLFDWCPVLLDTGDPEKREYTVVPGQRVALGLFERYKADGELLVDPVLRRTHIGFLTLLYVKPESMIAVMTDGNKIDGKYVEIEISPEGKVPEDRWPVKRN